MCGRPGFEVNSHGDIPCVKNHGQVKNHLTCTVQIRIYNVQYATVYATNTA